MKAPTQQEGVDAKVLGDLLVLDPRTIRRLASDGIIKRIAPGRYALKESVQGYCAHIRTQAAGRATKEGKIDPIEESALLRREQRQLAELRRANLEGRLISIEEVKAVWRDLVISTQQLFLSVPSRARFDLPKLTGADQKVLKRLCIDMLAETAFGRKGASAPIPMRRADDAEG